MSNYTKSTNFATKDNLTPGDPLKVVRGTEIDTEYNNIATAIATKTDNASAAITGGTITGITDLAVADGGTGASTAAGALNNLLPSQTSAANKYLQSDGTNASWDAVTLSTADITGTLPVANGGTGVTSSTGTGSVVLSNSPTLVTPALGTPASGVATNLTGLPISTGVSGLGTGVATFLGTPSSANLASAVSDETGSGALVFANSPTLVTPALGTPSALVGTNITGTASGLTAGNVTTNANLTGAVTSVGNATSLGSFSSANLLGALTDETGTGSAVFATSPTLVTPILGTPTSATLTNATGLPIATGVSGLGTGVATFLATPSSANLRSALTDETGTGSAVFATSPTLVTPVLGTPTSGTLTNCTGLPNAGLVNSSITIGGTAIALGASSNALANDITVYGVTVGRGAGAVSDNTVVGSGALAVNTTGARNSAFGNGALAANITGTDNAAFGRLALTANTGSGNNAFGSAALYSNTTGGSNQAFGDGALFTNISGSRNVAVGGSALYTNTGSDNTGIGYFALKLNTTGANNVALGKDALTANTTASNNTAVGYQAGYTNVTGVITALGWRAGYTYNTNATENFGSTFLGSGSGITTSSGIDNSFVGASAGRLNTTGSYNTALGGGSLYNNTTANNNTAVGYQSSFKNITGLSNSALGVQTLYQNTAGSYNTAVGNYALENNTASNNTAVGYQALYANTTGVNNVALGYQAGNAIISNGYSTFVGTYAGLYTTGGDSTFVGYGAGNLITSGAKNTIIGSYNGNQFSLDIRTASNYIVLSDGDGNIRFSANASFFSINGIDADGQIGGTPTKTALGANISDGFRLNQVGTSYWNRASTGTIVEFRSSGTAVGSISVTGSATAYNTTSDQRLKENIQNADSASSLIDSLQVRKFDWKSDNTHQRYGFVAQELAAVYPEAVHQPEDTEQMMAVDYSKLVPLLVKEIQSLKARLDAANL